ncbi:MAG TPA: YlbF family regulator [Tepidisphaeraceae bacterium]|jgi:cell fate (sporulation/competence/biofilm development) regulator YlbF (YheA/YmcA/DUF963 family)|nr:YlbF family regulator [Tepidisphaeraceae bacterium]
MPVEESEILQTAEKLGQLVAQHPSVAKFKTAQKAVADDPDASRLLADFNRQLETLVRQEQSGMPVTDAQRTQLESLQSRIVSHIKVKALNLAEVDFMDIMRKVSQTWQKPLSDTAAAQSAGASRLAR